MYRISFFAAAVATALAGCAQTMVQFAPSEPPLVKVTLQQASSGASVMYNYYADDHDCYGLKANPPWVVPDRHVEMVSVKHRRFFTFNARYWEWSGGGRSCTAVYTFPIEAGKEYAIETAWDKVQCTVQVTERPEGGSADAWRPTNAFKRNWFIARSSVNGPWCDADPRFAGSSVIVPPRATKP